MIRLLDPVADAEAVLDLYRRAADYVELETGRAPDAAKVAEYFADAPPGRDALTCLKLGLFEEERILGIGDLAVGYPRERDAYLGLMLIAKESRGRGVGRTFLRHVEETARERGATRLLLAVLEANPRARAFWESEGFGSPRVFPPVSIGDRTHVRVELHKML